MIWHKNVFFFLMLYFYVMGLGAESFYVKSVSEFQHKQGWFLTADVGVFTVLGGFSDPLVLPLEAKNILRQPRFASGIQPYVGMMVGYDVWKYLAVGIKVGRGYVASAARLPADINSPTDYALSFLDSALVGSFLIYERIQFSGGVFLGLVIMTPGIFPDARRFGVDVGASLGVHYQTLLDGLFVGLDVNGRMSLIPNANIGILPGIVSISLIPLIGYVF
jgi:hypothetical protein